MKKLTINYSQTQVTLTIGHHYIQEHLKNLPLTTRYIIITDQNIDNLYHNLFDSVPNLIAKFVVESGENSKSFTVYQHLLTEMLKQNVQKSDVILAIGGGVVTDLAGMIAGTYKRGLPYISIPTTLLGMVDASIGGKCAINVAEYKNQVGMFYHPLEILIDDFWLSTLHESEYQNGMAEIIKIACTSDEIFFDKLALHQCSIFEMIEKAVLLKIALVEQDERDQNLRQLLNFGHTMGHLIEKESHYQIPHGQAIAYGMIIETANHNIRTILKKVLKSYGLLSQPIPYITNSKELWSDKKIFNDEITLVVVDSIGHATLEKRKIMEVIHE